MPRTSLGSAPGARRCRRTEARNAARVSWARAKIPTEKDFCSLVQQYASAESCISKAVAERGLTPGPDGLADAKRRTKPLRGGTISHRPMGIEWPDPGPRDAPGGILGVIEGASRGQMNGAMRRAGVVAEGVPTPSSRAVVSGLGWGFIGTGAATRIPPSRSGTVKDQGRFEVYRHPRRWGRRREFRDHDHPAGTTPGARRGSPSPALRGPQAGSDRTRPGRRCVACP
jgi:hypothetical protein